MPFCEPTKNCEHKAPKILLTEGESRSMFCECIWGGGAAPLQLSLFEAYLLYRVSPSPPETSAPPIDTIEKQFPK